MQLVRVIYKTPPSASEGALVKLKRKFGEWWLAPVIYRELTRDGSDRMLKQWAANHLWLAQRTGGAPLHGIELASRIVFGKEAKDLSIAEQFVLASAVNRPIILLQGSDRLNAVRLDRWRYLTEVRARTCAEQLITDEALQRQVVFDLVAMAGGPPDPRIKPRLQQALDRYAPTLAHAAQANPVIRANALMLSARYGIREEMKEAYGFGWRDHVRGVTTTFDAADNLAFAVKEQARLAQLDARFASNIDPGYTLDPAKVSAGAQEPERHRGGRQCARRDRALLRGGRDGVLFRLAVRARCRRRDITTRRAKAAWSPPPARSSRRSRSPTPGAIRRQTLYLDRQAPAQGLEACGHGQRAALALGAGHVCLLAQRSAPHPHRAHRPGARRQAHRRLRLHHAAGRASGEGHAALDRRRPGPGRSLAAPRAPLGGRRACEPHRARGDARAGALAGQELTTTRARDGAGRATLTPAAIVPDKIIRRGGARPAAPAALGTALLRGRRAAAGNAQEPLQVVRGAARRCEAALRQDGTQVTTDRDATVDAWIAGGLQFASGAAYSYVVVVGTGSASEPWARKLHASQVAAPLLETLLQDLEADAKPCAAIVGAARRHHSGCATRGGCDAHAIQSPTERRDVAQQCATAFRHSSAALKTKTMATNAMDHEAGADLKTLKARGVSRNRWADGRAVCVPARRAMFAAKS